jgi:hypothetical protein
VEPETVEPSTSNPKPTKSKARATTSKQSEPEKHILKPRNSKKTTPGLFL